MSKRSGTNLSSPLLSASIAGFASSSILTNHCCLISGSTVVPQRSCKVLSRLQAGNVLPVVLLRQLKLLHSHCDPVFETRPLVALPSHSRLDLRKDPGIAKGTAAHHNAVCAGSLQAFHGSLPVGDIAVGDHRDVQLIFYLVNGVPVSHAGIEHGFGSAVDGDQVSACLLHPSGKIQIIEVSLVPAQAAFHRHRYVHRFFNSCDDLSCQFRGPHQAGAVTVVGDLRHRAAHVDIDKITAGDLQRQLSAPGHDLGIVAENLGTADAAGILL